MASSSKFGTFGGVFTPSILTILGVIMYLRLPWIVGEGGLYMVVGIILAAHLISVTTGLSVSSIATDKKVEAGGAYYIVSRSMGLSMGGTLGIALFVGLSFSISLYIIGFTESALDYFEVAKDLPSIRLWGTVTLAALTFITFVSTSLAIKTQYLILVAIAASLVSIFAGSWDGPVGDPVLMPFEGGAAATALFGIFFPAVTGFTAGVNMSGDLKDPKRAIPVGTVASIAVGLVVYILLAVFLAFRVPGAALREPGVLLTLAWSPRLVVAGIWGATLSSALGSILGAPRILQALSLDKITPRIFGVGTGPTNEPRVALFVAFVIGELGILIGELDAIARIVSVFFLATYGFLNLSASFEMIASPDFRPSFRIPRWVPMLGAVTCGVLMIWLDLVAMMGAVVVLAILFAIIKRRQLQLDSGDAVLGVWTSVIRVGLDRLSRSADHQRNWLPNILLFSHLDAAARAPLLAFGHSLVRQRGVVNELALDTAADDPSATYEHTVPGADDGIARLMALPGFYSRSISVPVGELFQTMSAAAQFFGVDGHRPNTIMVDWHEHASEPEPFARFLDLAGTLDLNMMCLAYEGTLGFAEHARIDLWWTPRAGNLSLNLALIRFFAASDEWRRAEVRLFVVSDDATRVDSLYRRASKMVDDARVQAQVTVVDNGVERRSDAEWVAQYSAAADLTVVGIPAGPIRSEQVKGLERLGRSIGGVLLVRASSTFADPSDLTASSSLERVVTEETSAGGEATRGVLLPDDVDLAAVAERFRVEHAAAMVAVVELAVRPGLRAQAVLLAELAHTVDRELTELVATVTRRWAFQRERTFSRQSGRLLQALADLLDDYQRDQVATHQRQAETGLGELADHLDALVAGTPRRVAVVRPPKALADQDSDTPSLRRRKRWLRVWARLRSGAATQSVRTGPLASFYARASTPALVANGMTRAAAQSALVYEDIRRFFSVLKGSLEALQGQLVEGQLDAAFADAERARLRQHLVGLQATHDAAADALVTSVLGEGRALRQAYATDLDVLEQRRLVRRERRISGVDRRRLADLREVPARWAETERLLVTSTRLSVRVAVIQGDLAVGVRSLTGGLRRLIREGARGACADLGETLQGVRARLEAGDIGELGIAERRAELRIEGAPLAATLGRVVHQAVSAVVEEETFLREASLTSLETDPFAEVEVGRVAVRQRMQLLLDARLAVPIAEIITELPRASQHAQGVMNDVVRLVRFNLSELDAGGVTTPEEVRQVLIPVVTHGAARVAQEVAALDALADDLVARVQERLRDANDVLNGCAIRASVEGFDAYAMQRVAAESQTRLGRWTARVRHGLRSAMVRLAYRESAGVLLARRLQHEDPVGDGAELLVSVVDAVTPSPAALDALPFYYKQLFLGHSAVHTAFWVGRDESLSRVSVALARHGRGRAGPIVVTGAPLSGKSALVDVSIDRFLGDRAVYRVRPTVSTVASVAAFEQALRAVFRLSGSADQILRAVPHGTVVVLYDLERWWERSAEGLVVMEHIMALVRAHGGRCLFFFEVGLPLYRFMVQLGVMGGEALAVVETGPVDAETLERVITLRHSAAGMRYSVGGRDEGELSDLARAKLFTAHFRATGGNIGAALRGWVAHVDRVEDGQMVLTLPVSPGVDVLRRLPPGSLALLVELALHRSLARARLAHLLGDAASTLDADLGRLRRVGLVVEQARGAVALSPDVRALVHDALRDMEVLP